MENSNSHDSSQSGPRIINLDDSFPRKPTHRPHNSEKITIKPIELKHHNVSVAESVSLSQEHIISRRNMISPVKRPQYKRQAAAVLSPKYIESPLKRPSVSHSDNLISVTPQQAMSSVEQSFVVEAEQLVQAVSKTSSDTVTERSNRNSTPKEQEVEEVQLEENKEEEVQEQEQEEEEEGAGQQPVQPAKKNASEFSRSVTKTERNESQSQQSRIDRLVTPRNKHVSRVYPDQEIELDRELVYPLQTPKRHNISQVVPEKLVRSGTKSVTQIGNETNAKSVIVAQVERSLTRQKSGILKNMSLASRQSQFFSKIDLEDHMRNEMEPRDHSRDETKYNSNLVEKQRISELMLKQGKEISVVQEEVKSGFDKLADMKGLCFKQKFEVVEGIGSWEVQHRTYVHDYATDPKTCAEQVFQCNENSSFCSKQCLSNCCRPFSVTINVCDDKVDPDDFPPFLLLERTCSCGCLWFNRPAVTVRWVENGKRTYMGKIVDAFNCGDIKLHVYDHNDVLLYEIGGNCCQGGMLCNCYCESCQTVEFNVTPTGEGRIMHLQKKSVLMSEVKFPNADRFTMEFCETARPEEKALLLSAILFLESRHFEGDL